MPIRCLELIAVASAARPPENPIWRHRGAQAGLVALQEALQHFADILVNMKAVGDLDCLRRAARRPLGIVEGAAA